MRILWLVNKPFPEMVQALNLKGDFPGCWTPALKRALVDVPDFRLGSKDQLGIACSLTGISEYRQLDIDGVTYYCLPKSKGCEYLQSYEKELLHCLRAVEEFKPDLIHVHGTEEFYGLLTELVVVPVVVSIKGVLSACVRVYLESMSWAEILRSPAVIRHYLMMRRKTRTERKIFRINRYFIGRTLWDKSHLIALAEDDPVYYQCHEVIREEFYDHEWSIEKARPATVACISSCYAYKGVDCVVEAISFLRRRIPDVRLFIYGYFPDEGYGALLRRKVKKSGLQDRVHFCGFRDAKQLAVELSTVRALAIASHIENGSNSLQEARLVGTPVVASFAGGMFSIVEHEKTSLMFPRGDAAVMAECLYRVLTDDRLVVRLSQSGRIEARRFNNPELIIDNLLEIYEDVIERYRGQN